jgi:hypothetical protein
MKICLEKVLGFDRVHENKNIFLFFETENSFKSFFNFLIFFRNISEKIEYFNTGSVSYSIKI